ncbi:fungal-specific transcription factor domain-containing protein [Tricharina praecox]|uniref:fungal-specific transcription factor domain-containing protein n=1 Tax=Tricharina praecox TaxID=43433 RepID=UPI002220C92C|nr:fungal-specific transcription factor domain-containing protein [Tricharina praecox]KAI5848861.1 fungal-specific transcription factor domain-containing protein [Tricharina praecox]
MASHHDSANHSAESTESYQDDMEEAPRGRERSRDGPGGDMMEGSETSGSGQIGAETPTTRKRRRSRKGLDKKFECPYPGCGKSYSRAEHLYRHQLNHQPKQIYFCDFPQCKRSFVRQDLCTRHRERHTNRGSHLQRKDNLERTSLHIKSMNDPKSTLPSKYSLSPESPTAPMLIKREAQSPSQPPHPGGGMASVQHMFSDKNSVSASVDNSGPEVMFSARRSPRVQPPGLNVVSNKPGLSRPTLQAVTTPTTNMHGLSLQSPYTASPAPSSATSFSSSLGNNAPAPAQPASAPAQSSGAQFANQPGYQPFALPQPAYPSLSHPATTVSGHSYIPPGATTISMEQSIAAATTQSMDPLDPMSLQYTIPVFGESGYSRSPQWGHVAGMAGDWLDMLMGADPGGNQMAMGNPYNLDIQGIPQDIYGVQDYQHTFFSTSLNTHPMNINTIAPPSPPQESLLSDNKRQQVLYMVDGFADVQSNFPEGILSGSSAEDERHPLSLSMMQTYISLYWAHFHPQLPILHRPTFSTEKTPDVLLLCVIIIGAACIDIKHEPDMALVAMDMANLVSRNMRWTIFGEEDFRPPAKLWVFQALLLLETFEKMYADRRLHERAHIHHATTLTLMRRGSSLTGRSGAFDSPQSGRDAKSGSDGSSITFSGQPGGGTGNSSDEAWNRWIMQEATKRVAFAAFVIDATHATMFGHSAVMVAHEMRLQLPCDETLWAANNASEVFSIQQSLLQNNVHTPTFLEGLRKTLRGEHVSTNAFGRTILMSGLLSVGWHLNQRDVQISSLGVVQQLGGKERWRATLTQSFDHWKKDFDTSLDKLRHQNIGGVYYATGDIEHENIFESRIVLHHLAHMSMHVDIVDLQIYAGARRLLGRSITRHDAENTRKKVKQWAPTAQARDAAFYALQFLSKVLLPEERADMQYDDNDDQPPTPNSRTMSVAGSTTGVPVYSARDDHLLNRPWVLYVACLVVWSYGYALEGSLEQPVRMPANQQEAFASMRTFLKAAGLLKSPTELGGMLNKNACLGLLVTLQEMFVQCRWELLIEAARLLKNCINITTGDISN